MANRLTRWARPNDTFGEDLEEALGSIKEASHSIYSPLARIVTSKSAKTPENRASYWQPNQHLGQDIKQVGVAGKDLLHAIYSPIKKGADTIKPYADRFLDPLATFAASNAGISLAIGAVGLAAGALAPDSAAEWTREHPVATGLAAGTAIAATYGLANWKLIVPKMKEQWERTTAPTLKNYAKTLIAYPLLATALVLGNAQEPGFKNWVDDWSTGDAVWEGIKETPGAALGYIGDKAGATIGYIGDKIIFWGDERSNEDAPKRASTTGAYRSPLPMSMDEVTSNLQVRHLYWNGGNGSAAYKAQKCDPSHLKDGNGGLINRFGQTGKKRTHGGADLPAPLGTELYTPTEVTVKEKDSNWKEERRGTPEYNNGNHLVFETKDGDWMWYLHMDDKDFGGQIVENKTYPAGTFVGRVGVTGNGEIDNPHLHVQIREGGRNGPQVDPFPYFTGCR